jgi:hypothetical protein
VRPAPSIGSMLEWPTGEKGRVGRIFAYSNIVRPEAPSFNSLVAEVAGPLVKQDGTLMTEPVNSENVAGVSADGARATFRFTLPEGLRQKGLSGNIVLSDEDGINSKPALLLLPAPQL